MSPPTHPQVHIYYTTYTLTNEEGLAEGSSEVINRLNFKAAGKGTSTLLISCGVVVFELTASTKSFSKQRIEVVHPIFPLPFSGRR